MHRSKVCFKCGERKALTEYYKHPMMGDGYLGKCKECAKQDVRENRKKRRDYYVAFDKARANAPHRVEARKEYAKTPAGKASKAKALRKLREVRPDKYLAHNMVGNAIRDGRLLKEPCTRCGSTRLIHAHHER